nr:MAG TPA: plasmid partitioning protein RepA [Caudoviricetes sp.]
MEKFTTARAAQILDISTQTLKRWYKWYNSDAYEKPQDLKLPQPEITSSGTMLFTMAQVQELSKFKQDLQTVYRGCMAEFNAYWQWGKRGTDILRRRENKSNEQKG